MLTCFGDIGGIYGILELAGKIIVSIFSKRIFLFSILSSMYQVIQNSKKGSTETHKESINQNDNNNPPIERKKTQIQELNIQSIIGKSIKIFDQGNDSHDFKEQNPPSKNIQYLKDHDLDKRLVENAMNSMKLRYRYNYSVLDFAYNLLFPF